MRITKVSKKKKVNCWNTINQKIGIKFCSASTENVSVHEYIN